VQSVTTGKQWLSQLDPSKRDEALRALDFDGVLLTTLTFGPLKYFFPNPIIVESKLIDLRTGTLAWSSRCEVQTERIPIMSWAQHRAARCMMSGALVGEGLEQVVREVP